MSLHVSYILLYDETAEGVPPALVGVWRGSFPRGDAESIGLLVRQGLAGFSVGATWKDLAEQLENSGLRFYRADVPVHEVMQIGQDVVRIIFLASGQISCQWLTCGPDNTAQAADKPIAILPSREDN